jgi:hypothetical protein
VVETADTGMPAAENLSSAIMDSDGFIEPLAAGYDSWMGEKPFVPPAVPMALLSPPSEEVSKTAVAAKRTSKALGTSRSEPPALEAFLQMNPEEKFDLEVVNSIDTRAIVEQAREDKRVLHQVVRTAEALLPRVRAETEDPILVSGILRDKTLDWFRRSPTDRTWAEIVPLRWGGIFHESRVPGGRLSRKLSVRLTGLISQCVDAAGTMAFLRAGVTGLFRGSAMMAKAVQFSLGSKRPRFTQQVAQAYLDDLANGPREGESSLPLERLSDLARRNGSTEVNMTLTELFPQETANLLTVIDPRFHPGMSAVSIRIVPARNQEDAATYDLVQSAPRSFKKSGSVDTTSVDADPRSPWERDGITKKDWAVLLRDLAKRKGKLDPPPRDNPRDRESYLSLKELILTDAAARKSFLGVHWKGRPSGLVLLCELLSKGSLVPEVETDGDYLEAELDHLDQDLDGREGEWDVGHGWKVVREKGTGGDRTYRATGKPGD